MNETGPGYILGLFVFVVKIYVIYPSIWFTTSHSA